MFNYEPQSDVKVPRQPLWSISVSLFKSRQAYFHINSTKRPLRLADIYIHPLISPSLRFSWRHVPETFSDYGSLELNIMPSKDLRRPLTEIGTEAHVTVIVIYNKTMKCIFNPITIFPFLTRLIIHFTHLCFHGWTIIKAEIRRSTILPYK